MKSLPLSFRPATGWMCSSGILETSASAGTFRMTFFIIGRKGPVSTGTLVAASSFFGTPTTFNSATPSLTSCKSPPIPNFPRRNLSRHLRRYRRLLAGSMPSSRSWLDVSVNNASHEGIFAACCLRFRPMSVRNVCGSGTNAVGAGICPALRCWWRCRDGVRIEGRRKEGKVWSLAALTIMIASVRVAILKTIGR